MINKKQLLAIRHFHTKSYNDLTLLGQVQSVLSAKFIKEQALLPALIIASREERSNVSAKNLKQQLNEPDLPVATSSELDVHTLNAVKDTILRNKFQNLLWTALAVSHEPALKRYSEQIGMKKDFIKHGEGFLVSSDSWQDMFDVKAGNFEVKYVKASEHDELEKVELPKMEQIGVLAELDMTDLENVYRLLKFNFSNVFEQFAYRFGR